MPEFLTRDQFLKGGKNREYGYATMPDGGKLRLRSLTEIERASWIDGWLNHTDLKIQGHQRKTFFRCRVLQLCAVNDAGQKLFNEEDIPEIARINCGWVARGCSEAMKLCGMDDSDVDSEADAADEAGNLLPPDDDSTN